MIRIITTARWEAQNSLLTGSAPTVRACTQLKEGDVIDIIERITGKGLCICRTSREEVGYYVESGVKTEAEVHLFLPVATLTPL